jgi:hypothetical protein
MKYLLITLFSIKREWFYPDVDGTVASLTFVSIECHFPFHLTVYWGRYTLLPWVSAHAVFFACNSYPLLPSPC